jgi:DNA-binding MarR family transcriptional regulator
MSLTKTQFDLIDLLYTMDCDTRPCHRDDLALRLNISSDAANMRMKRMQKAGLVTITTERGSEGRVTYTLTDHAHHAFRDALNAMDPMQPIPSVSHLIELPALIAHRIITLEHAA